MDGNNIFQTPCKCMLSLTKIFYHLYINVSIIEIIKNGLILIYNSVSDPHFFADPNPGGIRGVKGKNEEKIDFFHVSDVSEQLEKK